VRSIPNEPGAKRFLGGVWLFWFGAALVWPVLPPYILNDLGAPTLYFAISQLSAAIIGVVMQRKWGKWGDERGTMFVLLFSGIGASIVPALWGVIPVYWIGFAVEMIGFVAWPGHMLGLTLRSVELARHEQDRAELLGWTNLAQGSGAFLSPLIASLLVGVVGTVPILFASTGLRLLGILIIAAPGRVPSFGRRAPEPEHSA
jgi:MFS family permease